MTDPVRSIVARADALMQKRRTSQNEALPEGDDGIPVLSIDFDDVPTLTQVAEADDDIPVLTLALEEPALAEAPFPPAPAAPNDALPPEWAPVAPPTAAQPEEETRWAPSAPSLPDDQPEAAAPTEESTVVALEEEPLPAAPLPETDAKVAGDTAPYFAMAGADLAQEEELPEPEPPALDLEALSRELADQVRSRLLAELPTLVEAALQATLHELTDTLRDGLRDTTDAALKDFIKSHIKPITAGKNRP